LLNRLICSALVLVAAPLTVGAFEENAANIIADHVRAEGHSCEKPKDAKRESQASRPDEAVWILHCENATYRVRLIPDMRDDIQRID
jgi:hypothetical protein